MVKGLFRESVGAQPASLTPVKPVVSATKWLQKRDSTAGLKTMLPRTWAPFSAFSPPKASWGTQKGPFFEVPNLTDVLNLRRVAASVGLPPAPLPHACHRSRNSGRAVAGPELDPSQGLARAGEMDGCSTYLASFLRA